MNNVGVGSPTLEHWVLNKVPGSRKHVSPRALHFFEPVGLPCCTPLYRSWLNEEEIRGFPESIVKGSCVRSPWRAICTGLPPAQSKHRATCQEVIHSGLVDVSASMLKPAGCPHPRCPAALAASSLPVRRCASLLDEPDFSLGVESWPLWHGMASWAQASLYCPVV